MSKVHPINEIGMKVLLDLEEKLNKGQLDNVSAGRLLDTYNVERHNDRN